MAQEDDQIRAALKPSEVHTDIEFPIDPKESEAVIDCIRRTGKITIRFQDVGLSTLPPDLRKAVVAID
jgi:hypothetical protein